MDDPRDICFPISDINKVLEWKCDQNCWIHKHSVSAICDKTEFVCTGCLFDVRNENAVYPEHKLPHSVVPKTIVCHDYKGGYLEDKFCNGSPNIATYRFWNWSVIDIFIYFSHNLVTIPPCGWIDAGHKHGVPVLGTLITEFAGGEKICNDILSDSDKTNLFSQKLAEICAHFQFDGYLINIENRISIENIPHLINFLAQLKSHLDFYCKKKTWLLWYDSVTIHGMLRGQNKLCVFNKPFFDKCDGIFLNYWWTAGHLQESLREAGDRKLDVYVGVDVWGRHTNYGGGFNLDQALKVLRSFNMSVAIFAPGWTFEAAPENQFAQRELTFWKKLAPYLYIHGPAKLPFDTNFCQGILYKGGRALFNLSAMQYQRTSQPCALENNRISPCLVENILNGNKKLSLEVKAGRQEHSKLFHRVFVCDFSGEGETETLLEVGLVLRNSPRERADLFQLYFIVEEKLSIDAKQSARKTFTHNSHRANSQVNDINVVATVMDFTKENLSNEVRIKKKPIDSDIETRPLDTVAFLLKLAPKTSMTEILVQPPPFGSVLWDSIHISACPSSVW